MKKHLFAALLAMMLVLSLAAVASAEEYNWDIGICTKINIRSTDTPTCYIASTFENNDTVALSPGSGTVKLYDADKNLLYEGSVYCLPSIVQPGERAYFSVEVPASRFTNEDGVVDSYDFDFEPRETSLSYKKLPATAKMGALDNYNGYELTISVTNNTGAPLEDFNLAGVLIDNADGEPLYRTTSDYIYNRIPDGSTILFNTYVPEAVMNLINKEGINFSVEALVYVME